MPDQNLFLALSASDYSSSNLSTFADHFLYFGKFFCVRDPVVDDDDHIRVEDDHLLPSPRQPLPG